MNQRDRLIEILNKKIHPRIGADPAEVVADFLLDNGVIVPPCKVLKKVYVLPTIANNLTDVTEMKCIGYAISHDSANVNLVNDKNKLYQPCFGDFGKTVFLTREEADKALEG